MIASLKNKLARSAAVYQLTRKYWRPGQVPEDCCFYINGQPHQVRGQHALSLLINLISEDCYGLKRFKNLPNIVDIGANIGVFALHAATLFPEAKVVAYEPFQESLKNLRSNTAGVNCEVRAEAVGGAKGLVKMVSLEDLSAIYVEPLDADFGETGESGADGANHETCPMVDLDEVVARMGGSIALLKMDCEGSEYEIMRSPALQKVSYIVGEFHTCAHGVPDEGLKTLREHGFHIDRYVPFPDGKAGEVWASNSRNTATEASWLAR